LFADQGHDVVALSLTGGPPPPPEADPKVRAVRNRLDHIKADDILKIRLDCLNYTGGEHGAVPLRHSMWSYSAAI